MKGNACEISFVALYVSDKNDDIIGLFPTEITYFSITLYNQMLS